MSQLIIHGGKPLKGTTKPVPNKNSILKIIPACVLTDEPVLLRNVPHTSDVQYMLQIIQKLGWSYTWTNHDDVTINCSNIHSQTIDAELSEKMKASVMFAWPLLTKFGKVLMPNPQGCKLWTRPMDVFMDNMVKMGASYHYDQWLYTIQATQLHGTKVRQEFPSVTGTENMILMAVMAQWTTEIYNAACEPHTQDLCNFLVSMWAVIEGIGSNKLIIHGVKKLSWTQRTIISDHLDVAWLITATVMTWWNVTIEHAVVEHMDMTIQAMKKLWISLDIDVKKDTIHVGKQENLIISKTIKGDLLELSAWPRPLLPMDLMPVLLVLAMHCQWSAIIANSYYTAQFFFIQELAKMKWRTVMADPHRVITFWPSDWQAANMQCGDIIQSSYGMLMAALAAPWISTLNAITPLFRRFPNFVEQFNSLGAELELVD